jgi:hypothetical protein
MERHLEHYAASTSIGDAHFHHFRFFCVQWYVPITIRASRHAQKCSCLQGARVEKEDDSTSYPILSSLDVSPLHKRIATVARLRVVSVSSVPSERKTKSISRL